MKFKVEKLKINKLFYYLNKNKYLYILALSCDAISRAGLYIVQTYLIKKIVNESMVGNTSEIIKIFLMFLMIVIVISILGPYANYILVKISKNITSEIKIKMYEKIEGLDLSYYQKYKTGDLISRIYNDMNVLESIYSMQLPSFCFPIVYGITSLIYMIYLDYKLCLVIVVMQLIIIVFNNKIKEEIFEIDMNVNKNFQQIINKIVELVQGFCTIKMFNIENFIKERFNNNESNYIKINTRSIQKKSMIGTLNNFFNSIAFVIVTIIGGYLFKQKNLGTLVAMIQLQNGVMLLFSQIGTILIEMQNCLVSAERIFQLFNEKSEMYETYVNSNGNIFENDNNKQCNGIQIKKLKYKHFLDTSSVIKDLNIIIPNSKICTLIGASGIGKSTLIKVLMGFYKVVDNCVTINGKDINNYNVNELRELIAYMPQDTYLFSGTIEENIRYGCLDTSQEEIIKVAKMVRANGFIEKLPDGYQTLIGKGGVELSLGQKQRICLARTIIKKAEIFLFDEPLNSLDNELQFSIEKSLKEILCDKTVLIVTHNLKVAEKSDIIFIMDDGQIKGVGTHDELLNSNALYKSYYVNNNNN